MAYFLLLPQLIFRFNKTKGKTVLKKLFSLALILFASQAYADYKQDVGYSQLQATLGTSIPNGNGIAVTQVEAAIGASTNNVGAWMLNASLSEFSGKIITDLSIPTSNAISGHATGVGSLFYGNSSMASGITDIDVYSATHWINNSAIISAENNRIVNHSWIGNLSANPSSNEIAAVSNILKHVDRSVEESETIQITALNNGTSAPPPLIASAYNTISVGRTDGNHASGSAALDSVYTAGRTRPDLVAPKTTTSSATPIVSAAAAMLIEQASTAAGTTLSISNGERSEVVKAVMMAGADRSTNNTTGAQITDYRAETINQSANGLDSRYGAGQVNVYNNYQIIDTGEQDSQEDGGNATVAMMGYDYDANFGGQGNSNSSASYLFDTTQTGGLELTASLVWNIDIENAPGPGSALTATLYNLDLLLFDITSGSNVLLANSNSTLDNTENIWHSLEQNHQYKLEVVAANGSSFNWDYALAWQIKPVPVPAAIWLFISGLLGLFGLRRNTSMQAKFVS